MSAQEAALSSLLGPEASLEADAASLVVFPFNSCSAAVLREAPSRASNGAAADSCGGSWLLRLASDARL